jgi:putative sigma-54 modulation protein
MNLVIQGSNNFSVSDNIREHIKKRLEKLNYFKNHITEINFHLDAEKIDFKVDVTMAVKKLGVLKFQDIDKSMYQAIDKIVHKMDVKINREKTKIQDHHGKAGHEDLVDFYYEHEKNVAEPTTRIEILAKAVSLKDAYAEIQKNHNEFTGFYSAADNAGAITFLKNNHDSISLLKKKADSKYAEFSLKLNGSSVEVDKELREIPLIKVTLLDAQKDILDQDYYFGIYSEASTGKIGLLYKEDNGKWKLLS